MTLSITFTQVLQKKSTKKQRQSLKLLPFPLNCILWNKGVNLKTLTLSIEPVQNFPAWVVACFFFIPFLGGLLFYLYKTRHVRLWRKGVYPTKLKFTEDNLLEAYLALGSLLILLDYQQSKEKIRFINEYFNRYFRNATYSFGDSLLFSMRHPMQIDSVSLWLNNHLKTEGERSQVIYFLTGLGMLDGKISQRELQFLEIMNQKLGLPRANLERIISIFKNYHESKKSSYTSSQKNPRAVRNKET